MTRLQSTLCCCFPPPTASSSPSCTGASAATRSSSRQFQAVHHRVGPARRRSNTPIRPQPWPAWSNASPSRAANTIVLSRRLINRDFERGHRRRRPKCRPAIAGAAQGARIRPVQQHHRQRRRLAAPCSTWSSLPRAPRAQFAGTRSPAKAHAAARRLRAAAGAGGQHVRLASSCKRLGRRSRMCCRPIRSSWGAPPRHLATRTANEVLAGAALISVLSLAVGQPAGAAPPPAAGGSCQPRKRGALPGAWSRTRRRPSSSTTPCKSA
jgi:hypothetical protein